MEKNIRSSQLIIFLSLVVAGISLLPCPASAASMGDYCALPPFVSQPTPPLVMLEAGRDHKFFYEAFNDATDIDEDGQIDLTYKHTIDYYGYFDHHKCYTYSGGGSPQFNPIATTSTKFCAAGQWSGNMLNWMTMSRMDVLKKVLYGGQRSTDSNETVLSRVYIPEDAHSWGKEVTGKLCFNGSQYTYQCKRNNDCDTASGYACVSPRGKYLIPFAAATPPYDCSFTSAVADIGSKITVARYRHSNSSCGTDHADLMASYEVTAGNFIDTFQITDFSDARVDPAPPASHYDNYNIFAVAEFNVASSAKGDWQFFVDGDDGVEVEIDGTVVASYYGCHARCVTTALPSEVTCPNQMGTINLNSSGYHKIIVRHTEQTSQDGVAVWYRKKSTDAWSLFPSGLTYRTKNIIAGAECTIQNPSFINDGIPVVGTPGGQHLFCSTTLSDGGTPILRMIPDNTHRIWEWASKERPVCSTTFSDGTSTGTITDYTVKVKVCDSTVGLESNCKTYGGSSYKPVGLLQKYGENTTGAMVCSKNMAKVCNSNADCTFSTDGQCVYKADMLFGFMSTSYTNNLSGGVLRKNIGSILDETNINNGYFQTSENVQGNIIMTFDRFRPIGFRYSDYSYQDPSGGSCGWITDRALNEGECRMWGNPIGEMMYEGVRYFAGKNTPTVGFDYSGSQDSGLSLSHPTWGYRDGATYYPPYTVFPTCARPFTLILSDVNTSYDFDELPGSSFSSFAEDSNLPTLNLNVSALANIIGDAEGITNNNWFVGESGSTNDFLCTSKNIPSLAAAKGLCPEEPTKKGTYYSAAVAYYGKTLMKANTGRPNIDTFVIALASPLADMKFKAGSNMVTVLPIGKSVSGCLGVYNACAANCTLTYDGPVGNKKLSITGCTNAYCPSNQIVDLYLDSIKYDADKNVVYAKYRINFEDVEQGADHDMDSIVTYEICTQAAIDAGYGACGGSLGSGIQVKVDSSQYGAGCIDQAMGFVISGTTEDGAYLVVKDNDVNAADADTPSVVYNMPKTYSHTFSTTGTPAGILKNPLWYAAKWGGFDDFDGDNKPFTNSTCGTATPDPKCKEWDKNGDGIPDNYFLVVNPQKLEDQMNDALLAMLTRATSGTAASVLASGEGSGANLIQATYYPKRKFFSDTVNWVGGLQNLWYYIDPMFTSSNIREDGGARILNLQNTDADAEHKDYITQFFFDPADQKAKAKRFRDSNGDGAADSLIDTIEFEQLSNLWEAGKVLWNTPAANRSIYTALTTTAALTAAANTFSASNYAALRPWLNTDAAGATAAENDQLAANIIDYVRGVDIANYTHSGNTVTETYRARTTKIDLNGNGNVTDTNVTVSGVSMDETVAKVWKLGDIIDSTPRIASWVPLNGYDKAYGDADYTAFISSPTYTGRGMVYVGANDGTLHAFKLGNLELKWTGQNTQYQKARLTGTDLGKEIWAFIPRNALPYLKYLKDNDYCHINYIDLTPYLFDASINKPGACSPSDPYWKCEKTVDSWRTILIGGMKLGGACKNSTVTCTDVSGDGNKDCVNTPVDGNGYSSYFALDVTDQNAPKLLWEYSHPELGFTTSGPAVVRISSRTVSGSTSNPDQGNTNGRWFVVFGSGPTGPIDAGSKKFMGNSDQPLKLFVLDLATGALATSAPIDTLIPYAFAGSMLNATVDSDLDYQDDAVYIPYVKRAGAGPYTWTDGGVLRLLTNEDLNGNDVSPTGNTALNPANWRFSKVMDGIGPVTSSVVRLQKKDAGKMWLYFGTGRYFYRSSSGTDDADGQRHLFGVREPCFVNGSYDPVCLDSSTANDYTRTISELTSVDTTTTAGVSDDQGWYIALEPSGTHTYDENNNGTTADDIAKGYNAERVITDPLASTTGVVFFTSYEPYNDPCSIGGKSFVWAVKYDNGAAAGSLLQGTALIQVSTGSIEQMKLSDAFKSKGDRRTGALEGVPPTAQGLSLMTTPPPLKKILHVRER